MGSRFPDHYNSPVNPWGTPPGLSEPEFKVMDTTGSVPAVYVADVVKVSVVPGEYNTIKVDWPSVAGAVNYTIRRGFSLYYSQSVVEAPAVVGTTHTFKFSPTVPPDSVMNVWVVANFAAPTPPILVQSEPASVERLEDYLVRSNNPLEPTDHTLSHYNSRDYADVVGDNDYMRFIAAEIRRRALLMLRNDGEWFTLYVRRWSGTRCNCNEVQANFVHGPDAIQGDIVDPTKGIGAPPDTSADPQYDALARCPLCWGTGIRGGYYYGIPTYMRYGELPQRQIIFKNFAVDIPHNFNTWTVWEPKLHTHDLVWRRKTGQYFVVEDAARGEWRAVPFHQEAKLNLLPPGDPRQTVTDDSILAAETAP